jgi:hypothetical protein
VLDRRAIEPVAVHADNRGFSSELDCVNTLRRKPSAAHVQHLAQRDDRHCDRDSKEQHRAAGRRPRANVPTLRVFRLVDLRRHGHHGVPANAVAWTTAPANAPLITADLLEPTKIIPVSSASAFTVGSLVVLRSPATEEFVNALAYPLWTGTTAVGGPRFLRRVVARDLAANTITVDIPTRYPLLTRDAAVAYPAGPHLSEVGLEDFTIGMDTHPSGSGLCAAGSICDMETEAALPFNSTMSSTAGFAASTRTRRRIRVFTSHHTDFSCT